MGDVNHSPASVLASKQLRTDWKPSRDGDISFLIGEAGWASAAEAPESCSETNTSPQSQAGNLEVSWPPHGWETPPPTGGRPSSPEPTALGQEQRIACCTEVREVLRDKEQARVARAGFIFSYFWFLVLALSDTRQPQRSERRTAEQVGREGREVLTKYFFS